MGKTRKKNKPTRNCPTGLKSVKDVELEDEEQYSAGCSSQKKSLLAGAIEKLQSPSIEARECGSEVIAMNASRPNALEELLQLDVVRIAAPLLLDKSLTVRHSIAGALRNLTVFGGHTVCEHMIQQDVLTPLVHLFKKFYKTWSPAVPKVGKIDSQTEIFIEVTHILWNLCESSEQAVSIFNNEHLLPIFLQCLNVKVYGHEVALAAGQCLHAVTEDNSFLWSQTPLESCKELILNLLTLEGDQPDVHHLRILAAGIYLNINKGKLVGCPSTESFTVLQALSQVLDVSLPDALESLPVEDHEQYAGKKEEESADSKEVFCSPKEKLLTLLRAKQISLEILTNLCCDDDEADDWESLCSSNSSEDMALPMEEDCPNESNMLSMPCEIQEALTKQNIVPKVEAHIFLPELDHCKLSKHEDLSKKFETVRCRALLCLHNVVTGIDIEDGLSGGQNLQNLWIRMAKLVFDSAERGQNELLEASTSCLRAILQRLAEAKVLSCISNISLSDLNALYKVVDDCSDTKVRVNILRIAATLGYLLGSAYSAETDQFLLSIGQFLIEIGLKDTDIWANAEAADALMDVFAEDHLDPLTKQISLVKNCRQILSILKTKGSNQRNQLQEHRQTIAIAKTNLSRFIKYKTMQQSNGHS